MIKTTPLLTVIAAAIRDDTGRVWSVPQPGRHHDVIRYMREHGFAGSVSGGRQGFILSDGSFCQRGMAKEIASAAGQIKAGRVTIGLLMSEDIW